MILMFILLIVGFVLLVKGSDVFVDGCSSMAKLLGIPSIIVGLTIVSMGTSAPEAAVSITAGIKGANEIAFSNLNGSNIFNTLCVAGCSAAIMPFAVDRLVIKRDFPIYICIGALVLIMALDGMISAFDGVVLLIVFAAYLGYLVYSAMKNREVMADDEERPMPIFKSILFILIGLAAIILGGQLVVKSATEIARTFDLSKTLIGVTVCAIGTSLPELATSIAAAKKGESDIAIGNVVGSNIFNLAFILGMSSAITPIAVVPEAMTDTIIMLVTGALVFAFCAAGKKLGRVQGITSVLIYIVYAIYLVNR